MCSLQAKAGQRHLRIVCCSLAHIERCPRMWAADLSLVGLSPEETVVFVETLLSALFSETEIRNRILQRRLGGVSRGKSSGFVTTIPFR